MYVQSIKTNEIYPFSEELLKTGRYKIYEKLCLDQDSFKDSEELVDNSTIELLRKLPKDCLDKETVECYLEQLLTNREYNKIMEIVTYGR
jgi:hypothetical protein